MICLSVPFNTDLSPNSHISATIPSASVANAIYIPDTALIYSKGSPPIQLTTLGVVMDKSEDQNRTITEPGAGTRKSTNPGCHLRTYCRFVRQAYDPRSR